MISLRQAQRSDADAIAHIHTAGWKDTYVKVMSSSFLTNHAQEDRLSHWRSALSQRSDNEMVCVAEYNGKIEGFICLKLYNDAQWGCYIDSLHVSSSLRGKGAGKHLLRYAAEWVKDRDGESPLYLWVFEDNTKAIAFYQRLGGTIVERAVSDMPSSDNAPVARISWKNASQLLTYTY
ncbi:GNAT family N-acetyltransferase [Pantoea stewartii]|uniref:GNAT family N-acetyltransferase n=1 Tax=Pantoea stewartii TaxID=66269 RepID=UPI00198265FA|nr:GNAT family N-acetyltransferase [Pantoea stewartii]